MTCAKRELGINSSGNFCKKGIMMGGDICCLKVVLKVLWNKLNLIVNSNIFDGYTEVDYPRFGYQ